MPDDASSKVCCIVPTLNAGEGLHRLLLSIDRQTFKPDLFIVDSRSDDGTLELVQGHAKAICSVSRKEFNHGATRQMMVDRFPEHDIYLFLTQDAILADDRAIEKLMLPFADPEVGCVYGRQLPHADATLLASHARYFNYPATSHVRSLEDARTLGIKAAFISNSFAAYRAGALQDVGGFPERVILSEDMYVAASMLLKGWKVAYAADATCRHSHNYRLFEEFSRYFDIGVFHARTSWIREKLGGVEGEGMKYVRSELKFLGWQRCYLWPSSLLRNALKFIGFRLGLMESCLPVKIKSALSMHSRFWLF